MLMSVKQERGNKRLRATFGPPQRFQCRLAEAFCKTFELDINVEEFIKISTSNLIPNFKKNVEKCEKLHLSH